MLILLVCSFIKCEASMFIEVYCFRHCETGQTLLPDGVLTAKVLEIGNFFVFVV